MDQQFIEDLDCFTDAFSELLVIVCEQVKNQPIMHFDSIGMILYRQICSLNERAQEFHRAARSERSDQRALDGGH